MKKYYSLEILFCAVLKRYVSQNIDAITGTLRLNRSGIIERLDRKLISRGLISSRRLVGSCFKMELDGSITVEICDKKMAKMRCKPVEM